MNTDKPSLFGKLSSGIAFDDRPAASATDAQWLGGQAGKIPPLRLRRRSGLARHRWALLGALAAVLLAVIFGTVYVELDTISDYTPKGHPKVSLYFLRGVESQPLKSGVTLQPGDRILAEVLAPRPMVAYWTVVNRAGKSLMDEAQILASAITIEPPEPATFRTSIELIGAGKEGETIMVFVCGGALQRGQIAQLVGAGNSDCSRYEHVLR